MQHLRSPLAPYVQQLLDFHDRNDEEPQPIAEFFALLAQPHRPEELCGLENQIAWTRLVLLFESYGIAESEFLEYGVTPFELVQWRGGTQRPDDPAYQRTFVEHFKNILNVRACVHR